MSVVFRRSKTSSVPLLPGKPPERPPQRPGRWAPKCSTAPLLPLWPSGEVPLAAGPAAGEDPEAVLPMFADPEKLEEEDGGRAGMLRDWQTAHTWRGAHVPALQVRRKPRRNPHSPTSHSPTSQHALLARNF